MNETDKVKMTLNIGGEHIQLAVPFNQQDAVRDAEKAAAQLFADWKLKWPKHSDTRILAMVAYQFSMVYNSLLAIHKEAVENLEKCENALDNILDDSQS